MRWAAGWSLEASLVMVWYEREAARALPLPPECLTGRVVVLRLIGQSWHQHINKRKGMRFLKAGASKRYAQSNCRQRRKPSVVSQAPWDFRRVVHSAG